MSQPSADSGNPPALLKASGPRLVIANAHVLKEQGMSLINAGATNLIIDLAEIEFIDSSGIGALIGLRKNLKHGQVTLKNQTKFVQLVLRKTKTDLVFNIA
ncbi:MAG: STAS domain-containing protein [Pseudomonadota bacterium]